METSSKSVQEAIGKLHAQRGSDFRLRIGLNTGPVVAGGIRGVPVLIPLGRYGQPGQRDAGPRPSGALQTTEAVYLRASESFRVESVGIVDLRGRKVAAYLLVGSER